MNGFSYGTSNIEVNSSLLVKMIEQDMRSKRVGHYQITDEVLHFRDDGSKVDTNYKIEVGSNEAVYIYHLFTTPNMYDDLILSSSSSTAIYNEFNTLRIEWGETGSGNNSQNFRSYSSGLISKHFSDVLIDIPHRHNGPPGGRFVIRYVRVNYSPRKKKKK